MKPSILFSIKRVSYNFSTVTIITGGDKLPPEGRSRFLFFGDLCGIFWFGWGCFAATPGQVCGSECCGLLGVCVESVREALSHIFTHNHTQNEMLLCGCIWKSPSRQRACVGAYCVPVVYITPQTQY
jgi:hypothetical protein